jgi:hypothetical protein
MAAARGRECTRARPAGPNSVNVRKCTDTGVSLPCAVGMSPLISSWRAKVYATPLAFIPLSWLKQPKRRLPLGRGHFAAGSGDCNNSLSQFKRLARATLTATLRFLRRLGTLAESVSCGSVCRVATEKALLLARKARQPLNWLRAQRQQPQGGVDLLPSSGGRADFGNCGDANEHRYVRVEPKLGRFEDEHDFYVIRGYRPEHLPHRSIACAPSLTQYVKSPSGCAVRPLNRCGDSARRSVVTAIRRWQADSVASRTAEVYRNSRAFVSDLS